MKNLKILNSKCKTGYFSQKISLTNYFSLVKYSLSIKNKYKGILDL